jgi:hypothetical protein
LDGRPYRNKLSSGWTNTIARFELLKEEPGGDPGMVKVSILATIQVNLDDRNLVFHEGGAHTLRFGADEAFAEVSVTVTPPTAEEKDLCAKLADLPVLLFVADPSDCHKVNPELVLRLEQLELEYRSLPQANCLRTMVGLAKGCAAVNRQLARLDARGSAPGGREEFDQELIALKPYFQTIPEIPTCPAEAAAKSSLANISLLEARRATTLKTAEALLAEVEAAANALAESQFAGTAASQAELIRRDVAAVRAAARRRLPAEWRLWGRRGGLLWRRESG